MFIITIIINITSIFLYLNNFLLSFSLSLCLTHTIDSHSIHLYYQNVRSIKSKPNYLKATCSSDTYNILGLTETWLNNDYYSGEYFDLNAFEVYRADRDPRHKKSGGGCLLAVKSCLKPTYIALPGIFNQQFYSIDTIIIKCHTNNLNVTITCIYIPPDIKSNIICEYFKNLYQLLDNIQGEIIIIGDFNISNFINNTYANLDSKVEALSEFHTLLNLTQYNYLSRLDLVFSSLNCEVNIAADPVVAIEECHPPLDISINFPVTPQLKFNTTFLHHSSISTHNYNFKSSNFDIIQQK